MNAVAPPAAAAVSGWRWPAIVIGLGVLLLLYIAATISRRGWNGRTLLEGADGQPSISKFQWLLWAAVTLFAYTALWVLRGVAGHYPAVGRIPVGLVVIFALSVGTGVAAAGIASARDRKGRDALAVALISRGRTPGGIFRDDTGVLDLSKVQLLAFTLAAAGVFLADFVRQVVSSPLAAGLADIDPSLVFLVGISQCSYLVRKYVVSRSPAWRADQPSGTARTACAWLILVGAGLAMVRTFGSGVFAAPRSGCSGSRRSPWSCSTSRGWPTARPWPGATAGTRPPPSSRPHVPGPRIWCSSPWPWPGLASAWSDLSSPSSRAVRSFSWARRRCWAC